MKLAFFPRAAVSVAARYCCQDVPLYLMVQRGNEPNKGMWSLPGGKIKLGESTIQAAQRELWEETKLGKTMIIGSSSACTTVLKWHSIPFTSTDFVQYSDDVTSVITDPSVEQELQRSAVSFHYVISQCFAEVTTTTINAHPPTVIACDDAMDARWWTMLDVIEGVQKGTVSVGCDVVLERAEGLYNLGLLS